ncbi:ArsR/SmtB family transcription factor [Oricola cellulosilytica]|uniref:ArsR family transcriptional regulator n=1 Tax=Oricola cellulosilytica TaxID=1429082 RepID=A0A4R0PB26_9HYPH|nr:metalloregulator ArsR/SmtB family transcription factor [Oricola cellulosilytica]TCD14246.1 ArsR family transcriptional regulator [Oricola cellulosilytica]
MDKSSAVEALHALAQETRLEVFRLLVRCGNDGMVAGEIASTLGVRQNTMSSNLAVLARAGLVRNERNGREIRYFAEFDGMRALLAYLMEDCCGGNPEVCAPVLDEIACAC